MMICFLTVGARYAGTATGAANLMFQVGNGSVDTSSNYSGTQLEGTGSSALSRRWSNQTYWQGYYDAKIKLRNKLYEKENIPTKEPNVVPLDEWSPEFNLTIFERDIYGKK